MIPTLNQRGFMSAELDPVSDQFAVDAPSLGHRVLDVGCAYGIATLAALNNGATVLAVDMDERHLQLVEESVPAEQRARLSLQQGEIPGLAMTSQSFGAVHAARVLHFLNGAQVMQALGEFGDWLVPGGRIYVTVDTPYTGFWARLAPEYEQRKAAGEPWPGFIPDISVLFPDGAPAGFVDYLNPMDEATLVDACTQAGFAVTWSGTFGPGGAPGNAHAGVIARLE